MKKRVVLLLTSLFLWVSLIFAQDVPVGVGYGLQKGKLSGTKRVSG